MSNMIFNLLRGIGRVMKLKLGAKEVATIKSQLKEIDSQLIEVGFPINIHIEDSLSIIWDILDRKSDAQNYFENTE